MAQNSSHAVEAGRLRRYLHEVSPTGAIDAVSILGRIRPYIEATGRTERFPNIGMYAAWALHPQVDRQHAVYSILEQLTAVIVAAADGNDIPLMLNTAEKLLGMGELHNELRAVLTEVDAPTHIVGPVAWPRFRDSLFDAIADRPIAFPPGDPTTWRGPARDAYQRARSCIPPTANVSVVLIREVSVGYETILDDRRRTYRLRSIGDITIKPEFGFTSW